MGSRVGGGAASNVWEEGEEGEEGTPDGVFALVAKRAETAPGFKKTLQVTSMFDVTFLSGEAGRNAYLMTGWG